jgi:hypothetical protein
VGEVVYTVRFDAGEVWRDAQARGRESRKLMRYIRAHS